jgi:hypothetical protein
VTVLAVPATPPAEIELVPGEEKPRKRGKVIKASIRPETPRERLVRYLQQAVAVKSALIEGLEGMAQEVIDPGLRLTLGDHRALTGRQREELEARLRDLGSEPAGGKGALQRMLGWVWDTWQREPDDLDRSVQDLLKAMGSQEFEVSLSQSLVGLARALGDEATAEIAERHGRQKQEAVEQLRPFITTLAGLAVQMTAVARALRGPLKLEAEVTEEAPPAPQSVAPVGGP